VVAIAGDRLGDRHQIDEAQITAGCRIKTKSLPGRAPVGANVAIGDVSLEGLERAPDPMLKFRRADRVELLLRVMQVIQVDRPDPEVLAAPCSVRPRRARRAR